MTRRLALACSFALTVVVSFAVASLGVQAGWFSDTSQPAEAAAGEVLTTPDPQPAAIVIDETVFVDIPVSQAPVQQAAAPALPPVQQFAATDSRHRSGSDDDGHRHGRDDDDDDDDGRHHGRGNDDDDDHRHGRDDDDNGRRHSGDDDDDDRRHGRDDD